jgi:hypothetical protein
MEKYLNQSIFKNNTLSNIIKVFKYVNFKKLEVETGYTTNEPVQMADRSN